MFGRWNMSVAGGLDKTYIHQNCPLLTDRNLPIEIRKTLTKQPTEEHNS